MLREINITNFALIKQVDLKYEAGLNILSGETGAGKTIIVESLNLILGGRAEPKMVRTGEEEAVVEAYFQLNNGQRSRIKDLTGEDPGADLSVTRKITAEGASKAYLNGRTLPLSLLTEIGESLIDIHGQNQHQSILNQKIQLELLDSYGKEETGGILKKLGEELQAFISLTKELREKEDEINDKSGKQELIAFQVDELEKAAFFEDEEEALRETRDYLKNHMKIKEAFENAASILSGREESVVAGLYEAARMLKEIAPIKTIYNGYSERLEEIYLEAKELSAEIAGEAGYSEYESGNLEETEARLDMIFRFKEKYREETLEGLLRKLGDLKRQLGLLNGSDEDLNKLRGLRKLKGEIIKKLCFELSVIRRKLAKNLEKEITEEMKQLAMTEAEFKIDFAAPLPADPSGIEESEINPNGSDGLEFLISPNRGEKLKPLKKIISGGEMSRVMLAFKKILAAHDNIETLIFDEIDSGIGGKTAFSVGRRLSSISENHQVICLTHLPQIACYADKHFRIEKRIDGSRTRTEAVELDGKARVEEIARMLSGERITPKAIENAEELLSMKDGAKIAGPIL